jgi:uncharacterized SAM-binding protein YcdF (DUF218 family)
MRIKPYKYPKRRGLFSRLVRLCLWAMLPVIALYAWIVAEGLRENVFKADAIVVLGNAVSPQGKPSPRLAARLDRGLELYQQGLSGTIIVSGGTGWQGVDEAWAMKEYLVSKGVPGAHIVVDSDGYTTWDTARFTADWLRENGGDSAIAVSQYFHMPRTVMAMERFGVPRAGSAYARFVEWRDGYSISREAPGWLYYRFRAMPGGLEQ